MISDRQTNRQTDRQTDRHGQTETEVLRMNIVVMSRNKSRIPSIGVRVTTIPQT